MTVVVVDYIRSIMPSQITYLGILKWRVLVFVEIFIIL